MKRHYVLIVAGGRGSRMGSELPKQYLMLAGQTVLRRTVLGFLSMDRFAGVAVVIHPDDQALYEAATVGLSLLPVVHGGAERQQSVKNGLESLAAYTPDSVFIHDAARPFVDLATIDRILESLEENQGVVPGVMVSDTVRKVKNNLCQGTVDRTGLWRSQTPQAFPFPAILEAHRQFAEDPVTDDAALFEKAARQVVMVRGSEANFKITTPDDLIRAEKALEMSYEFRTGQGFDVHRFCDGNQVMLCGVNVAHSQGLAGHSDADVALHALTDAVLGAISAGDIGVHFPPTDPRWKGAASDQFLKHALDLCTEKGAVLTHVDLTIICERPKIGPHREQMIEKLSQILGISSNRISVKGTTTEKLGFTGRKEGIAAQAVATVRLPGGVD